MTGDEQKRPKVDNKRKLVTLGDVSSAWLRHVGCVENGFHRPGAGRPKLVWRICDGDHSQIDTKQEFLGLDLWKHAIRDKSSMIIHDPPIKSGLGTGHNLSKTNPCDPMKLDGVFNAKVANVSCKSISRHSPQQRTHLDAWRCMQNYLWISERNKNRLQWHTM